MGFLNVLRRNLCCLTFFSTPFLHRIRGNRTGTPKSEFTKSAKTHPPPRRPTNQQTELPRRDRRFKTFPSCVRDASFWKYSGNIPSSHQFVLRSI